VRGVEGRPRTSDADNQLTTGPSNSNPYHWNERQELQHVDSPDYNFYYDSAGRRETFDAFGVDIYYLYDDVFAAQSTTSGTPGSTQNYLTTPGGDVLAYSVTSGSTTTTTVPLTDLLGSTLGMVNSSGSLANTFTYEPFGKPTTAGQSTTYPYLFAGMEYDPQAGKVVPIMPLSGAGAHWREVLEEIHEFKLSIGELEYLKQVVSDESLANLLKSVEARPPRKVTLRLSRAKADRLRECLMDRLPKVGF
jgi:hypothetical protein